MHIQIVPVSITHRLLLLQYAVITSPRKTTLLNKFIRQNRQNDRQEREYS